MSKDWVGDIINMHGHYGLHEAFDNLDEEKSKKFLKFRADFIKEELNELYDSIDGEDSEEVVDALIDICVVAIGTLDAFDVDARKAWDEVLRPNMNKEVGVKESRPNPLGLPDLIKPEGWTGPDHSDNTGRIGKLFDPKTD